MPKQRDPVEALAKVLHRANERRYSEIGGFEPYEWDDESDDGRNRFRAMARAAIAHLSKPAPRKPGTIRQHVAAINRIGNAKPKRGAKRGK